MKSLSGRNGAVLYLFVFMIGVLVLWYKAYDKARPASRVTLEVPEDFRGAVRMVLNQPDGENPPRQPGKGYYFTVPPDGIVPLAWDSFPDPVRIYGMTNAGEKLPVPSIMEDGLKVEDDVVTLRGPKRVRGKTSVSDGLEVWLYVGTHDEMEEGFKKMEGR